MSQDTLENVDKIPTTIKKEDINILREYFRFMCTPENEFNCENCPESPDSVTPCIMDDNHQYPCGQNQCWVTLMKKKG